MSVEKRLEALEEEADQRRMAGFFETLTDEELVALLVAMQWPMDGYDLPSEKVRDLASAVRLRFYEYATPAERRAWWPPEELALLEAGHTSIEDLPIDPTLHDPLADLRRKPAPGDGLDLRDLLDYGDEYEEPRPPW